MAAGESPRNCWRNWRLVTRSLYYTFALRQNRRWTMFFERDVSWWKRWFGPTRVFL
jgi:hypothetical protein